MRCYRGISGWAPTLAGVTPLVGEGLPFPESLFN